MENCSCCYHIHSLKYDNLSLFNLLSICMVYISFHFPFYTKYRNTLVNMLQSKHTSYHNQNFVKRNIFAVPIAVVNDWSPIVLVLGNLLTPLYTTWLQSAFQMQDSSSYHPPLRTQSDPWPDATEILYIFKNVFN